MSDTIICRFVDGIEGATLLDLNDLTSYYYVEGSEFPLPKVLYDWVKNQFAHGQRLANWTLDNTTVKLRLCIKGTSRQDTYDKLNTLLTRLLNEGTLEIRMWGADSSVFYHTYPALPDLPDWGKKFIIDVNFITNITLEIPVYAEVKTSSETLWLIHAIGTNDDLENRDGDNFDGWNEIEAFNGTVTADVANYHSGAVGCRLTTTGDGIGLARIERRYDFVDETETHGFRIHAKKISGAPVLDVNLICCDAEDNVLDTLSLIIDLTPADANWHEVMNGIVVYPSSSGLTPRFAAGTVKVIRQIHNEAAVASAITIDDMWFGSVERVSDKRIEGVMGLKTLDGDVKGNLATLADVYITSTTFQGLWVLQSGDPDLPGRGISVLDDTHIWAVGAGGLISFFDGDTWTDQVSGTTNYLWDVYALDSTHVWAVGENGTILFFNGAAWAAQASGTAHTLYGVSGVDSTHVWAVGTESNIRFFNGANWAAQATTGTTFWDVSAVDSTHVWAVGTIGSVYFYNGAAWAAQASGTAESLYGVHALDNTHVWAIGNDGTIVFFDGTIWATQSIGISDILLDVFSVDSTHVWAVGQNGTILFFNGTAWVLQSSGTAEYLYGISGVDSSHLWILGQAGSVFFGVTASATMPVTNIILGQSDHFSEDWNPVLDAAGAAQTALITRRRSVYRQMAAGATEVFRFNAAAHKGKHMIVAGVSFGAATAFDKLTIQYKLQTTGGQDITSQTTADEIDCGFSAGDANTPTEFMDACCRPKPRLYSLPIPPQGVSENANLANIDVVVTVTAHASLATTMWLDYLGLVPYGRSKVEISEWAYNALIIDSRDLKRVLASLDGSLDTAQVYDATKQLGIPRFTADPAGMNLTIVCLNNVAGDYRVTFIPNVKIVYNPTYLIVAS